MREEQESLQFYHSTFLSILYRRLPPHTCVMNARSVQERCYMVILNNTRLLVVIVWMRHELLIFCDFFLEALRMAKERDMLLPKKLRLELYSAVWVENYHTIFASLSFSIRESPSMHDKQTQFDHQIFKCHFLHKRAKRTQQEEAFFNQFFERETRHCVSVNLDDAVGWISISLAESAALPVSSRTTTLYQLAREKLMKNFFVLVVFFVLSPLARSESSHVINSHRSV